VRSPIGSKEKLMKHHIVFGTHQPEMVSEFQREFIPKGDATRQPAKHPRAHIQGSHQMGHDKNDYSTTARESFIDRGIATSAALGSTVKLMRSHMVLGMHPPSYSTEKSEQFTQKKQDVQNLAGSSLKFYQQSELILGKDKVNYETEIESQMKKSADFLSEKYDPNQVRVHCC